MPSLSAYHLTWVSLILDMGYLLLVAAPDLGREVALLGHSCAAQLLLNSRSWWWTGTPGILLFMELQRVRHDWATELNWTEIIGLSWSSAPLWFFLYVRPFGIQVIYLTFLPLLPCLLFCFVLFFSFLWSPNSQNYGFSSSHAWIENWTIKKAECGRINVFKLWS